MEVKAHAGRRYEGWARLRAAFEETILSSCAVSGRARFRSGCSDSTTRARGRSYRSVFPFGISLWSRVLSGSLAKR